MPGEIKLGSRPLRGGGSSAIVLGGALIAVGCSSSRATFLPGLLEDGGGASDGSGNVGESSGSTGGNRSGTDSGDDSSGASSGEGLDGSSSANGSSGASTSDDGGACALNASSLRITEVDLGTTYLYSEVDSNGASLGLAPLALSPLPSGGSRVAFMGNDGMVHVAELDASDHLVAGSVFGLPAFDFQDLYADDKGGVVLVSRPALGGTSADHSCGNIDNLCGLTANYPTDDPCFDMYLVRFDGAAQTWAAKLTDTSATLPAYDTSATATSDVVFIWWYAHNGRIAFDGSNYGAYFGAAISVSQPCVGSSTLSTGINIHQGDRLKIVDGSGVVQNGGFDWGCSHSGYERVIWDSTAKKFVTVCKNDAPTGGESGRLAFAPNTTTIYPVDLDYSDFGNVLPAGSSGYWLTTTNIRPGQTANSDGLADVHLLHVTTGTADQDIVLASDSGLNDRAPHLSAYGKNRMLAAWETSTATGDLSQMDPDRKLHVQALNATTGATQGPVIDVTGITGSRYQDFRAYPDDSIAYAAPGSSGTKIKILRVLPCP